MIEMLAAAAADAASKVDVGWTPAATMGLIQNLLLSGGGGIGLRILFTHLQEMRKIAVKRAETIDARGDEQNASLLARVTELEKGISDERRDCDRKLSEVRQEYDKKLSEMESRFAGLTRQIITMQSARARELQLTPEMARALGTLDTIPGVNE